MKLSIITINYNNVDGLKKTIESVIGQSFTDFEYIIIDGGSVDGSLDVIKSYESNVTYWSSEKDSGIFDAMNKGVRKAAGDYLLMLNSGDYLADNDVLEKVSINIPGSNAGIIYGDLVWKGKEVDYNQTFPEKLSFNFFRQFSLGHQATFIKRELHTVVGLYDTALRICSDWKFFLLAICKYNVSYLHVPVCIAICGGDGISWDPDNTEVIRKEKEQTLKDYFPAFLPDYVLADAEKMNAKLYEKSIFFKMYRKIKSLNN